jgi:AraC-like DNA-binding protein
MRDRALEAFVREAQLAALDLVHVNEPTAIERCWRLVEQIPPVNTPTAVRIVRVILIQITVHLLHHLLPATLRQSLTAAARLSGAEDRASLQALFSQTLNALPFGNAADALLDARAAQALTELDRQFRRADCCLSTIADAVHLSPSHLERLVVRATARTFKQHLDDRRLAHADHLLRTSFLTVKEVANACGFTNAATFERNFKRHFGVTPSERRRHHS